ncbi:MAG TPA: TonB family protein [Thermoanaerobaculia bacterium]|nr:TonB family protein [Thermoanaerobaculia bacterium]
MVLLNEHIDGKYEILEKIREGGMGAIYKVRHRLLDEIRVVKVIRSQGEPVGEAADRFLSEAKAAIKLRHPNVAVLHDFAVGEGGQAFIVMEYIDGWNLLEVLSGYGPPPTSLTLEIARQSLKALGYLHRHKIVHRDVSPDNLMLTRDVDGNPLIKLIDLGIAKTLEGQGGLTTTGVFLGKPRYGSPERFSGAEWDERSDLYSFGVVLYELLTGRCPVTGTEPAALMAGHLFRPPLDFAETDPEGRVPQELRAIVLKALAKKPEERMASCEDFIWELTLLQDRFPLTREETEGVWRVLLPLGAGEVQAQEPPGSTQDHLDLQFGLTRTPAAGTLTGQSVRAEPSGVSTLAEVVPFSPSSRPAAPPPAPVPPISRPQLLGTREDLDSTWASRPMRVRPAAEPEKAPVAPPPPPSRLRGAAAAASPSRKPVWIAMVGAALMLVALGLWLAQRPAKVAQAEPAPAPAPAPKTIPSPPGTVSPAAVSPTPAPVSVPAATVPPAPAPAAAAEKPNPKLKPTPAEVKPAPAAPLEPMQAGAMIRRGQPNVEEPEVKTLASYSYPAAAKGSGTKVVIRLAVLVDENGQVIEAQIREGDKSGLGFDETALEAAKKTRFFPATRDGIAGKMWTELLLEFAE